MSQTIETKDPQTRIRSRKYAHSCCRMSQIIGALQSRPSSSLAPSRTRSVVGVPDFRSRIWRRSNRCITRGTWPASSLPTRSMRLLLGDLLERLALVLAELEGLVVVSGLA
eukprot:8964271-Heterocapsa_arctica.AAC.1